MKTKLFPVFVLAAGFITLGARAQVAQVSTPTSPAPAVETLIAPTASQFVYSPRLPSAAELTNVAAAQGLAIDKIVQSASQMTVVYRSANGQTNTVAYLLLPAAGSAVTTSPATTVVTTTAPATRVVYADPAYAPGYYYDPYYYPSYYGSPWYGPVGVSIGWGFGFHGGNGWHGGGFHGGGHHWR